MSEIDDAPGRADMKRDLREKMKAYFSAAFLISEKKGGPFAAYDYGVCETCGQDFIGDAMTLEMIRDHIDKFFDAVNHATPEMESPK